MRENPPHRLKSNKSLAHRRRPREERMALLNRRSLLAGCGTAVVAALAGIRVSHAEETPGVTATEIKIGSTTSLSGPVSALGVQARCQEAYFRIMATAFQVEIRA